MDCARDYCNLMGHDLKNGCPHIGQIKVLTHSFLNSVGPSQSRYMLQVTIFAVGSSFGFIVDYDLAAS